MPESHVHPQLMEVHRFTGKNILSISATILFFATSYSLNGQIKLPGWDIGLSSVAGIGDQAPFWIMSNRQGKFLPEKYTGSMGFKFIAESDTGRIIDYDYGVEVYGRHGRASDLWLHQAYAGITFYDIVRINAGMQEEIVGSLQPSISTGSVIWSGNARPMPKVEIGTPGYVPLPFTGGYVEMSGLLSHGWFEEGREERKDQFSWMLEVVSPVNFFDLEASVTIAADHGRMYGDNLGLLFTLRKRGNFLN